MDENEKSVYEDANAKNELMEKKISYQEKSNFSISHLNNQKKSDIKKSFSKQTINDDLLHTKMLVVNLKLSMQEVQESKN